MDFGFTDDQRALRDVLRQFVDREIVPVAREWEQSGRYPTEIVEGMKELGLFGITVPEEFGGNPLDAVSFALVFEEISRGWMGIAGILGSHSLACAMIARHGTDEQRTTYLPDLATGARRTGIALTEPDAGTDLQGIRTIAPPRRRPLRRHRHEDLDHERAARRPAARAREDRSHDDARAQGDVDPARRRRQRGLRGHEGHPEARLQGHGVVRGGPRRGPGPGGEPPRRRRGPWPAAGAVRPGERPHQRRRPQRGVAQRAYDEALAYAKDRRAFGQPISDFQAIQLQLAQMATQLQAARLMVYWAATKVDGDARADSETGMAKMFASDVALQNAIEALKVHGGYGYSTEYEVERLYRDSILMSIGEGTNDVLRTVIAKSLIKGDSRVA